MIGEEESREILFFTVFRSKEVIQSQVQLHPTGKKVTSHVHYMEYNRDGAA
jgi:hypothetical protein